MTVRLYEWEKTVTGGDWIEVTDNKVINLILRNLNNLIKINDNNEVYVELQLEDGLDSSDSLPIWVNVGRVVQADWRPVTGTLISGQTTSWDWVKILYWDDGEIRVDNGTWEWEILQYKLTAGEWIEIADKSYADTQWPCPDGFHVPTKDELTALVNVLKTTLALGSWDGVLKTYLKMPMAGFRNYVTTDISYLDTRFYYWSSTASIQSRAYCLTYDLWRYFVTDGTTRLTYWQSIRPFKNIPVSPDNTWTTLYDWSSIATWAGVFHNATLWLISISWDWTTWITIADKNLWATTVYNTWDTLSEDNCGWYFQWWNNYMFPFTGTVTSSSTQVDASWYWPWNYYSSDTFITWSVDWNKNWSSVTNDNLWWWVTKKITIKHVISNTWVLSVNWMTGHVNVNSWAIVSDVEPADAPAGTMWLDWSAWQLKISNGEWGRYGIDIDSRPR